MFFQVGRVKRGANAAKTDIISCVITGKSLCLIVLKLSRVADAAILVLSVLTTTLKME
jgi:hypothetical protein